MSTGNIAIAEVPVHSFSLPVSKNKANRAIIWLPHTIPGQQTDDGWSGISSGDMIMEKVLGIGGIFFRSKDPNSLSLWYAKHLGISPVPTSYDQEPWTQQEGPTVFAPFAEDTEYFGKSEQKWMINFRVKNMQAMVEQLEGAGIKVEVSAEEYPNGKFARLYDPEGNPIELWEPGE